MLPVKRMRGVWLMVDVAAFAGVFCAMNRLLAWMLPGWAQLLAVGGSALVLALARLIGRDAANDGRRWLAAWAPLALVTWGIGAGFGHGGTARAAGVTAATALGFGAGWHWLRGRLEVPAAEAWKEDVRFGLLIAMAIWCFQPFLTPRFLGGLDARWYLSNLTDALQQARAGIFPVFIGQGEFMFNGAVHPIRTAPYHHYLGILLDTLTLHVLSPIGIQHLTVLVTAVQGALGCYLCFVRLAPRARWRACGLALLYVSGALLLAYIYAQEMYMTFMAFGYLPFLLYGNVRVVRQNEWRAWWIVAAAAAAMWLCHPLVGMGAVLGTAVIQGLHLLTGDSTWPAWRRALSAGALGGVLLAYYFVAVNELGTVQPDGMRHMLFYVPVLLAGVAALCRFLATMRWRWLALVLLAGGVLWFSEHVNGAWLILSGLVGGIILLAARSRLSPAVRKYSPLFVAGVAVCSGVLVARLVPESDPERIPLYAGVIALMRSIQPGYLLPVSANAQSLGDLQLGYGLWALLVLGALAAVRSGTRELQLLAIAGLGLTGVVIPIPGVTRFLVTLIPNPIYTIMGTALWLRLNPILAGVALFCGALPVLAWEGRARWQRVAGATAMLAILAWNVAEAGKFIGRGEGATNTAEHTVEIQRPENSQLYSYSYDVLFMPAYFTGGVVDYHLESRLLRPLDFSVVPDPLLAKPPAQTWTLTTTPDPAGANWLHLEPKLRIAPGERQAWEFEFLDRPYDGTLIMRGNHGFYRSYALPVAGPREKCFGTGATNARSVAVWNTTAQTEEIELLFLRNEVPPGDPGFGGFGRLAVRPYQPQDLRIKTVSLLPYRAELEVSEPAILETPRVFIPGYQATIDGQPAAVASSPDNLAMIRLGPGRHVVELAYRGTLKVKLVLVLSAVGWMAVLWAIGRTWFWPKGSGDRMHGPESASA